MMSSIIGVAQLNRYISLKLKNDVKLSGLTVRGEITDFKVHYKSGHSYFALKEDGSQIKCVMFKNALSRNAFKPENGVNVLCTGDIEVYEPNGVYQIIVREMVPVGIGQKFLQIEAIKKKLADMGCFAPERKKPLPPLPKRIAVVTSLNGAAFLKRRGSARCAEHSGQAVPRRRGGNIPLAGAGRYRAFNDSSGAAGG